MGDKGGYINSICSKKSVFMGSKVLKTFFLRVNKSVSNLKVPGRNAPTSDSMVVLLETEIFSKYIHPLNIWVEINLYQIFQEI